MKSLASQAHFLNYSPSSFGWSDPQRDLSPLEVGGVTFGQCARRAHDLLTAFLTELEPHIPGGFHAGSCWCYSTTDDLAGGVWSFHHYGIAVDVDWNVNHMGNNIPDAHGRYAIPRAIATYLAHKYGMEWGGNWVGGYHDNMHFEIHVTPAVAMTVSGPITEDDELSAAEVKAITEHIDAGFQSLNGRLSTVERMESRTDSDVHAALAGIYQKLGVVFRGDPTHPDNLASLHAAVDALTPKAGG